MIALQAIPGQYVYLRIMLRIEEVMHISTWQYERFTKG